MQKPQTTSEKVNTPPDGSDGLLFPPPDGFIVFRVKITRLRNGGNYAEIHRNYAMGNLLMGPSPSLSPGRVRVYGGVRRDGRAVALTRNNSAENVGSSDSDAPNSNPVHEN